MDLVNLRTFAAIGQAVKDGYRNCLKGLKLWI